MKYQEQMSGITQQMMQQNPQAAGNPSMVEMAMAEAAQQVMNANQAMGMAQSPEQQLVALEQAKVELEKQKLQSDTASDAAELQLKNKELEIKETAQIIDMLKATGQADSRKEQMKLNRESKETIKQAELKTKEELELNKLELEKDKEIAKYMVEMIKQQMNDQKEIDQTTIENMLKVANQQITEMRNDAEG